jgi:purine-binding chemotaxis protein CheW
MDFVEGIVNLRGQIVPIVDLGKRFLVVERNEENQADRKIIVVNMAGQNIGILVDGVSEILRVPDESIEPTPPMVTSGMSNEFIRGVAKVKDRLIIFLDLDRIFSSDERELLGQSAV